MEGCGEADAESDWGNVRDVGEAEGGLPGTFATVVVEAGGEWLRGEEEAGK